MEDMKTFLELLPEPFVIILVGTPLVGKDTFTQKFELDKIAKIISRDKILLDVYGSDDYNKAFELVDQSEVDKLLVSEIKKSVESRQNVILNMTNLTKKRRLYNLSFFDDDYYKVAICFPILSESEYERRNLKRTKEDKKTIPSEVLKNMIKSFQPVSMMEGFDKIINL